MISLALLALNLWMACQDDDESWRARVCRVALPGTLAAQICAFGLAVWR
jgi:hypothetical protein